MEQHERIVHLGLAKQNRRHDFLHFHDEFVDALINGDGEHAGRLVETSLRKGQEKVMTALMMGSTDQISVVGINLSLE
jgi:DNA-binding FadR family transcriptional regulator